MGNAHAKITNDKSETVTVRSYNNADIVFAKHHATYTVAPGGTTDVEAAADAWGLKLTFSLDGGNNYSRAFFIKNGETRSVSEFGPLD